MQTPDTSAIDSLSPQDLPLWMRKAQRGIDWGLALALIFSLLAAWPLIVQQGLPRTNDSEHFVFRTAETAEAILEGRLYPRWSAAALGGYGAPLPHFTPPAPTYLAALVQVLFTGDPAAAVRIIYAAAILLAGAAIYKLGAQRGGTQVGVLACLLYVYSPYLGLIAPHLRGDLPAAVGMALLPLTLGAADRLLRFNQPIDFLTLWSGGTLLLLTDPRLAALALGLIALLALWVRARERAPLSPLSVVAALTLGLGAAAFFWLPALAESDAVRWQAGISAEDRPTLAALLAPLQLADPGALIPTPTWSLGLGPLIFAIVSAMIHILRRHVSLMLAALMVGLILIGALLAISPAPLWLLGPITLCLALGGSGAWLLFDRLPPRWRRRALPTLAAVVLALALPVWLYMQSAPAFGPSDQAARLQYEQLGFGVAGLPAGQPLPTTLPADFPPNRALIGSSTGEISKVSLEMVPSGAQIGVLEHQSHSDRFQVMTNVPVTLTILTAYFPGWRASLNNRTLPVAPDPETGLLTVELPERAQGELIISLNSTPARAAGWLVSAAAVLLAVVLTSIRARRAVEVDDEPSLLSIPDGRLLAAALLGFTLVLALFVLPFAPLRLTPRPGAALDHTSVLRSRTDGGLEALSFALDRTRTSPGGALTLTVYWHALRFLPENYQSSMILLDGADRRVAEVSPRPPGGYPTRRWVTNRFVADRRTLAIPTAVAAGQYRLAVEVYVCAATCPPEQRLTFFGPAGATLGQMLVLPVSITISQ